MTNVAQEVIWPLDPNILVRVVFLYVGQGASAIVLVADGGTYKTLLVDINHDLTNSGLDVPKLLADLLEDEGGRLGVFVNTHPHNDHLGGIVELSDTIEIGEVWHSGHNPGKDHGDAYDNLQNVIKKVKDAGGSEIELLGSSSPTAIGEASYYVLAPAEYVVDDIQDETPDVRYRRIHEQCAVIKFGSDPNWIMITGDSDRDAWEKHIANYHTDRLSAEILGAAHHGSRTFFRYDDEDEPYLDGLRNIAPTYVVISAPRRDESQHGHPHEDAVQFYADEVGADNVLHTGENRHSFICDIFRDQEISIQPDNGVLVDEYSTGDGKTMSVPAFVRTRVDRRPMGRN